MIRILYVDDERSLLDLTKEFLEQLEEDFRVDTALSAEEALKRLSEEEYDVVVSDYRMPEMDGLEFLSELRGQGSEIPFIMFTGKGQEEVAVEAFKRGAEGYVMRREDQTSQYGELANWIRQAVSRRQAEEQVRLLSDAIDTSIDSVLISDLDGNIAYVNRTFTEMWGYTYDEATGIGVFGLGLTDREEIEKIVSTVKREGVWSGELIGRRKDESTFHVHSTISLVRDNRGYPIAMLGVQRDVTERKKTEEALKEREERLRQIADNLGAGSVITDSNNVFTYVSPRRAEMLDYEPEEMQGKPASSFVQEYNHSKITTEFENRKRGKSSSYEVDLISKDGRTIPALLVGTPIFDMQGKFAGSYAIAIDITERKKMEEALREGEERYRNLIELAHVGIILTEGAERNITFANERMAKMLEYSMEELTMKSFIDLVHPDDMEEYLQDRKALFTSEKAATYERCFLRKDGSTLNVLVSVSSIDPRDRTESAPAICIITDITKHKRLDIALEESERRLLSIIENLGAGLGIQDKNGVYTYVNPARAKMLGNKPEEMIGKPATSFIHKDSLAKRDAEIAKRRRGESSTYEINLVSKDGRTVPVQAIGTPLLDEKGEFAGSYGLIVDLTERKQMEELLQESEERFRGIAERSYDGIFTVNLEGCFTYFSPAMEKITGYESEEMMGKRFHNFFPALQVSKIVQAMTEMIKTRTIDGFEVEGTRKDGSLVIVEINGSTIRRDGKVVGFQGIARDITQRKMMEDREQFLHSLLRHDLGNKLQGLYGYLDLLGRTGSSEKQKEYLSHMRTSLQGAGDLIARIRELRAVEEDKEITTVNLDLAIRTAIRAFPAQEKILYRGVPDAMVVASTLLRTVFTNLIENSIRHSLCTEITITVQELKDRYKVTVQDNGRGIPEVVRRSLFGRGVKSGDTSGTGLGLYLVKRIIDASKGTIQLKDTKKGTRFDIYLKKADT